MGDFGVIVWLLPIVFMLHDFEEIIFFRQWFERNKGYLEGRFPKFAPRIIRHVEAISTSGFALAVAEEFVLISAITLCSVLSGWSFLWLAAFMAFALHLVVHIVQWIALRRYIPAIATTFPALAYCGWVLGELISRNIFFFRQIALCGIVGTILMVVNLFFAHKLALRLR